MDSEWWFFVVLFLALNNRLSDCFQWTRNQQSSRVIKTQLGSDVSLPCEFLLTSDEESAMQQFHLIYWTRESPAGSQNWQGMASKTNLISNSEPRIIYHDKSRILMKNKSLTIFSVKHEDAAVYQCDVKSSFYTTPSFIKLDLIQMKSTANAQHSPLSNGASAGIGIGVTLLVVAVIILGAVFLKAKVARARRRTQAEGHTNMEYMQRNDGVDIVQSYENPVVLQTNGMHINGATSIEHSAWQSPLETKPIGDTSF